MPLLNPDHTDIIDLPENTRLRNTSRCDGRENIAMPSLRQLSRISSSTSVSSVLSPDVSTMSSIGRPSGSRRRPAASRSRQADRIEQRVGRLDVELRPRVAELRPEQRAALQHRVARFPAEPEVDDLVDFVPVDAERQRAPEAHVAHQLAPLGILGVEVRIERDLRAERLLPQPHVILVALLALLEERVVVEAQVARLQVDVAGAGLRRDQLVVGDADDDAVDVRKLPSRAVDAVEIRVAHEHEARGRQRRRVHPRLERRQVRVVEPELLVLLLMQPGPVARARLRRERVGLLEPGVARVELAQVVRGPIDVERTRTRERRQEHRIGLVPT